jgi:hypothetical protein
MTTTEAGIHSYQAVGRSTEPHQPPLAALFRFPFQRRYGGLFSNRHDKFLLREEHIAELRRLVTEHNKENTGCAALSMSDILNACLDFALEHPTAFRNRRHTTDLRDSLAHEVYRKALVHFMLHEIL